MIARFRQFDDAESPAFTEQALRYLDGQLDDDEVDLFLASLDNPAAQSRFVDVCLLTELLATTHASAHVMQGDGAERRMVELLDEAQCEESRRRERQAQLQRESQRRQSRDSARALAGIERPPFRPVKYYVIPEYVVYGLAAALVVAAFMIPWKSIFRSTPDQTQKVAVDEGASEKLKRPLVPSQPIAHLSAMHLARWSEAPAGLKPGTALFAQPMKLRRGLARLEFANGAVVVVEGPCEFQPLSSSEMRLTSGKVVASCRTASSQGFTIQTPLAEVIDLGTEFGVSVQPNGRTKTAVLDGRVEMASTVGQRAGELVSMSTGAAQAVDSTGALESVPFDELEFVREEEFQARALADSSPRHRSLAYQYRLRRDPQTLAYYSFDEPSVNDQQVLNLARATTGRLNAFLGDGRTESKPTLAEGRFGDRGSLRFFRKLGQSLNVPEWPSLGPMRELTISCWYRVDAPYAWPLLITQWNEQAESQNRFAFHLGLRDASVVKFGPRGRGLALQLHAPFDGDVNEGPGWYVKDEARDGDANDSLGEWTHAAATIRCGGGVRLYKNGVEIDAGDSPYPPAQIPYIQQPLVIGGKAVPYDRRIDETILSSYFDGWIDDVALIARELSAKEIKEMHRLQSPGP